MAILKNEQLQSQQEMLLDRLKEFGIATTLYTHEPVFTVEEAQRIAAAIPGAQCKNLFLKDSKKRLWLIVAVADTILSLKKISQELHAPELRFAQAELLKQYLQVEPGSVTPFGLLNDTHHIVTVILDKQLFSHALVGFHPLKNNATLTITPQDLELFIHRCGNTSRIMDFSTL